MKNKLLLLYFLLTIPILANDFYPLNITPANGAIHSQKSSIPITFDVCLGYNFPAAAGEWYVEVTILDSNGNVVYFETIQGFDANGPACFPITDAPDFIPNEDGNYSLKIQTYYAQEINSENDLLVSEFVVKSVIDLALVSIISPQPMAEYFIGSDFYFKILVRNEGDTKIEIDDYYIRIDLLSNDPNANYLLSFDNAPALEPGEEKELSEYIRKVKPTNKLDINKPLQISYVAVFKEDDNLSNNSLDGGTIEFVTTPIWPNEFRFHDGLSKTAKNLANTDFIEFVVTDKFSAPELYTFSVYDSSGQKVDSTLLDLFTIGETVDSFTVYSYEFSGDVLPNHGAISLSYDSLRFSDYFISWGGSITAVEGLWKDSISTDIGVTPIAGNSISLSGHGTDFSSFTWENSTPTPGLINDSQLVPVEEQPTLANHYKLEQNYPNPFNPTTKIRYSIPSNSLISSGAGGINVHLTIYDVLGREVRTLVNEVQSAGNYEVNLDASKLTSGVYYYQIIAGDFIETRKMSLLK